MRYLLSTFLGLLLFLGFSITPSSAAELNNEEIVVDRANYNSELDFENAVNSYMNDENILTVTVIDSNRTIEENLGVQPMSAFVPYADNVFLAGRTQGTQLLNTLWGEPGIEISLTNTFSASATLDGTISGFNKNSVSIAVGFSVSSTHAVSYTGKYTAPANHNGKKVRRVELSAYPVLDQYHFDYWVPERQIISTKYVRAGSGVAGKPVGVSYTKTYRYL
ncbi:hypothetical protein [Lysinibacillus sphaericus]|uniref:hypothetical protein n=1 Tax=Lysinibacillus sphaericus TaxID=1421 RepID=UPI002DB9831E|nr:hypothetical protein [Lysinibacillus sphaericus]MEB7454809.1 hypothetical protein [Lysinibacillus sphaericus]